MQQNPHTQQSMYLVMRNDLAHNKDVTEKSNDPAKKTSHVPAISDDAPADEDTTPIDSNASQTNPAGKDFGNRSQPQTFLRTTMASGPSKSVAFILLILNLGLYFIVTVIASWAVNHGIERARDSASVLSLPARIFPIYFPIGNMASGFFVIFSLIAGVVGMATSLTGIQNVLRWDSPNLHAASVSSLASWALTLLAMGLACKEINIGFTEANLRTLEVMTIIVSGTQLVCTGAIHAGVEDVIAKDRVHIGRV